MLFRIICIAVLTGWEVSDQTTPELMRYFYKNLKSGMSKGKALQQAKLEYLATANINRTAPFGQDFIW
ncbi:CHAT domain-containing protein [Aquimarina aquimarini]|uniref:CHAT domain-containing protein n=1 Tax=Aquimarina aquimarini TaxID=1191734 RepID=UPI002E21DC01